MHVEINTDISVSHTNAHMQTDYISSVASIHLYLLTTMPWLHISTHSGELYTTKAYQLKKHGLSLHVRCLQISTQNLSPNSCQRHMFDGCPPLSCIPRWICLQVLSTSVQLEWLLWECHGCTLWVHILTIQQLLADASSAIFLSSIQQMVCVLALP